MQSPTMMLYLPPFKEASANGAVIELKLRLLAGKWTALEKFSYTRKLEDVEDAIATFFAKYLSAEEIVSLELCRQLRNKILHANFQVARKTLNKLGHSTQSAGVKKLDVGDGSMESIAKAIQGARDGTAGVIVSDTTSTKGGGVYGWFLEAGASGDFQMASTAFQKAGEIIDRLTALSNVS